MPNTNTASAVSVVVTCAADITKAIVNLNTSDRVILATIAKQGSSAGHMANDLTPQGVVVGTAIMRFGMTASPDVLDKCIELLETAAAESHQADLALAAAQAKAKAEADAFDAAVAAAVAKAMAAQPKVETAPAVETAAVAVRVPADALRMPTLNEALAAAGCVAAVVVATPLAVAVLEGFLEVFDMELPSRRAAAPVKGWGSGHGVRVLGGVPVIGELAELGDEAWHAVFPRWNGRRG
jgi:hypothetical protein